MEDVNPFFIFTFQNPLNDIKRPNFDKVCYMHFCSKDVRDYEISTPQVILIWECLRLNTFALSHKCENACVP